MGYSYKRKDGDIEKADLNYVFYKVCSLVCFVSWLQSRLHIKFMSTESLSASCSARFLVCALHSRTRFHPNAILCFTTN